MNEQTVFSTFDLLDRLKLYSGCDYVKVEMGMDGELSFQFDWIELDWHCKAYFTPTKIQTAIFSIEDEIMEKVNYSKKQSGLFRQ